MEPTKPERMLSLDAFRGMTIAGMILVNNPGTWTAVYGPLQHAAWHGWTPTDLVFPFFLFIVGVAVTLALRKDQPGVHGKVVRRALIIFGLGLFLNGFPFFPLDTWRIPGVLQRIAIGYFFAAMIYLHTGWKNQARIALGLLLGYWLMMTAGGDLTKEGNLAAIIDRALLGKHNYTPVYDPEGLLSSVPAIGTALCGVLTGHWLRTQRTPFEKTAGMFVAGTTAVALGWVWNFWFPINKALWTSSYVIFTAGLALQFLALCYWLMDIHGYKAWAKPFIVYGSNALAVYFLSGLMGDVSVSFTVTQPNGQNWTLKKVVYESVFAPLASPVNASLLFALTYVAFWLAMMWLLYRKRIFIKV